MTTQAKGWIAIAGLLALTLIGYAMLMAWNSPTPVLDNVGEPTDTVNGAAQTDGASAQEQTEDVQKYITVDGQGSVDELATVVIDASLLPGSDVVTITIDGVSLVLDVDWSETKGGLVTYDRLIWNDASGELLTLIGPYELPSGGLMMLDEQAMTENPGQIYFATVEGRYYRYDSKSDPRLVLIEQTP